VQINGAQLPMEVNTGASLTLISKSSCGMCKQCHPFNPLTANSGLILEKYTGTGMGIANVAVSFQEQNHSLQLLIVAGDGPSLLGHDWLSKIHSRRTVPHSTTNLDFARHSR